MADGTRVNIATPDKMREAFLGQQWGEPHSGSFLHSNLSKLAVPIPGSGGGRPSIGVVLAVELALIDYVRSLDDSVAQYVVPALHMRKDEIAEIITADSESA